MKHDIKIEFEEMQYEIVLALRYTYDTSRLIHGMDYKMADRLTYTEPKNTIFGLLIAH